MKSMHTSRTTLTLPEPIKEWVKKRAKENKRSMGAEIAYRLEQMAAEKEPAND